MEWMILPYRRYADFSGRSRRREYWLFQLFFWVSLIVIMIASFGLDDAMGRGSTEPGPLATGGMILMVIFVLGSIIPSIAVTVRRFHDQDLSGWMYLLSFVPYIGGLVVFVFMCIGGTNGENRFGPDPKSNAVDAGIFA